MPALLPPERVLQEPQRDQTLVPLALGGSGLGQTRSSGANFATLPVLLCPTTPPLVVPAIPSGANLDVTSPRKPAPASTDWQLLKKLNVESAWDPTMPCLGVDPKEVKTGFHAKICT